MEKLKKPMTHDITPKPEITSAGCIQFTTALQYPSGFGLQTKSFHSSVLKSLSMLSVPHTTLLPHPCHAMLQFQIFSARKRRQGPSNRLKHFLSVLLAALLGSRVPTLHFVKKPGFRSVLAVSSGPCTTPDSALRRAARVLCS